jgi:glycine/D-amino acid oxidase-like deaminating enzyme
MAARAGKLPHVVVFGAGAFGGWTALELGRRGARVTLVDAWGPGNVRSSSGGDTRVMRATYGVHSVFSGLAVRALERWKAYEAEWNRTFFRRTGALWMFASDRGEHFAETSRGSLDGRVPVETLATREAARRFPQINFDGVSSVLYEPSAGYLLARRACEHVAERAVSQGVEYKLAAALAPVRLERTPCEAVTLHNGEAARGDAFVFACGPWLGTLFPDVVRDHLSVTRQEVLYFGVPAGEASYTEQHLPVWLDFGERLFYGIPAASQGGFKIADDTPGPSFDPTTGDRSPSSDEITRARQFLSRRFPALATAPLAGSEVCQYESTPDAHFIIDRHPRVRNVWIVGGGSGHGFKMGPAIGEMVAELVMNDGQPDSHFTLERFHSPPTGGWREKWS